MINECGLLQLFYCLVNVELYILKYRKFSLQSFFPFLLKEELNSFIKGEFPGPKLDKCDIKDQIDVVERHDKDWNFLKAEIPF